MPSLLYTPSYSNRNWGGASLSCVLGQEALSHITEASLKTEIHWRHVVMDFLNHCNLYFVVVLAS